MDRRMMSYPAILVTALLAACARPVTAPRVAQRSALEFLDAATLHWPSDHDGGRLVAVSPGSDRVDIYDNALAVLLDLRLGRREEAERILSSLVRLQSEDGSIAFSFDRRKAFEARGYVRAGALAWVGFAAVAYLNDARDGAARDKVARMCHELARYLLAHEIRAKGDPRDGLVTGGEGTLTYELVDGRIHEMFEPGAITWASAEHNIDSYFFLTALARVTARRDYAEAAERIRRALVGRLWSGAAGQLLRGIDLHGPDTILVLDCASWGSLFMAAAGESDRAEIAFAVGEERYAVRASNGDVTGHRPYARGPLLEDESLARTYTLPVRNWEAARAVWPEGSAGVALAALRLGKSDRSRAILSALEPLRDPSGGLPMLTIDVPFEFDRQPSVAGTVWVELVRDELAHPNLPPLVWPTAAAPPAPAP